MLLRIVEKSGGGVLHGAYLRRKASRGSEFISNAVVLSRNNSSVVDACRPQPFAAAF